MHTPAAPKEHAGIIDKGHGRPQGATRDLGLGVGMSASQRHAKAECGHRHVCATNQHHQPCGSLTPAAKLA